MTILDIIAMAGGLALFLFGMSTMGDSLAKMAGGKLEKFWKSSPPNVFSLYCWGLGLPQSFSHQVLLPLWLSASLTQAS